MYAQKIEGSSWIGEKIDKGKIDKMSGKEQGACGATRDRSCADEDFCLDQQLGQMYELMQAIRKQAQEGGEDVG